MAGQVAGHSAETAAARGRNNAKLKNHHRQTKEYEVTANLDNIQYLNDVQEQEFEQDATYQAMLDQWSDSDAQLKSIFAEQDFAIEDAIVEMQKNSYAGTQTGRTAGRLAAKSAKKLGQEKSEILHSLMMAKEEATVSKEISQKQPSSKSRDLYEQVRFAPIHGPTPMAPELEPPKSSASLLLGLGQTAIGGWKEANAPAE